MSDGSGPKVVKQGDPEPEIKQAENVRIANLIEKLPTHALSKPGQLIAAQRKPGRPRKIERAPNTSDLEYHAEIAEDRVHHVSTDPLVLAAQRHADPSDILHYVKTEIAKEVAVLEFQRIENEKHGKDSSQISSRRIDGLLKVANIELEVKKMGVTTIDLKSERMQRVFKYLIAKMREVAMETLSPQEVDLYFNRLATALANWEQECSDLMAHKE